MKKNADIKDSPHKKIVFAGNPNVGKSTIFNALTGMRQHTGNWTGKTVEFARGYYKNYTLIDLPGTYSLMSHSPEEEIARNYLCFEDYDCAVVVCDGVNLERSLNLAIQVAEISPNTVLCINMIDEVEKLGIKINCDKLSKLLGIQVFAVTSKSKKQLKDMINKIDFNKYRFYKRNADEDISAALSYIKPHIKNDFINDDWFALQILTNNEKIIDFYKTKYKPDIFENDDFIESLHNAKSYLESKNKLSKVTDIIITENFKTASFLVKETVVFPKKSQKKNIALDKLFTGKITALPFTLLILSLIIWLTVKGANYPSELLSVMFDKLQLILNKLLINLNIPKDIISFVLDGIYTTTAWVISVMLPPMVIFFPLFAILEDFGYLPRLAFNMDRCFYCAKSCGKQSLTMCMGLGCNAVGVTGCRIIDSERERLIAVLTNSLVPCNGKYPSLILVITVLLTMLNNYSEFLATTIMISLIIIGFIVTFIVSLILSTTVLKGKPSPFVLELPPYRTPQLKKIISCSLIDKTVRILLRAIIVSIPCGAVIWLLSFFKINNISIINYVIEFFEPIGRFLGMDGTIISAFILGLPANEIVFPLINMMYTSHDTLREIGNINKSVEILISNSWTVKTALCYIFFTLFHWPCSTTLITAYKETKSIKWTFLTFIIPTIIGITICFLINLL